MENTITATQAKAEFLGLIDRVASGVMGPVTVTKHGKATVMIVPVVGPTKKPRGYGALRGMAIACPNYDPFAPVVDQELTADVENLTR